MADYICHSFESLQFTPNFYISQNILELPHRDPLSFLFTLPKKSASKSILSKKQKKILKKGFYEIPDANPGDGFINPGEPLMRHVLFVAAVPSKH